MDGLLAPAWVVALGAAGFLGAKAVVMVRQSTNGNGKSGGFFEGRVVTLLENQTDELKELRKIAAATHETLQQQIALLTQHDRRAQNYMEKHD